MSIEHWQPRSGYPDSDEAERAQCGARALDWHNLLGVCVGVGVGPGEHRVMHCDQSRGSRRLSINPATTPHLTDRFKYNNVSGEMTPADPTDALARDDIATLNLNAPRLQANRAEAIAAARRILARDRSLASLRRLWKTAAVVQDGHLPQFAPVVERYLAKKLRERGHPVPP